MSTCQPGILDPLPRQARYLTFEQLPDGDPQQALAALAPLVDGDQVVLGIGRSLALQLGVEIPGLHDFAARSIPGTDIPSTPVALWLWLRGEDRGLLLHLSRQLEAALATGFSLEQVVDAFQHGQSQDLTGYEDGTENPKGQAAVDAVVVQGQGDGLDGSCYVAVQQWWHQLDHFEAMSDADKDDTFGRRLSDNEEFDEAPPAAHTKRTAQEDFDPPAFVVRRSMPWADGMAGGLVFVAFGKSLAAYEALLGRMLGDDDGIVDKLFDFTRPVTGAYFWCPPVRDGRIDLGLLGC